MNRFIFCGVAALFAACGGDDDEEATQNASPGTFNEANARSSAKTSVSTVANLQAGTTDGTSGGFALVGAAQSLGGSVSIGSGGVGQAAQAVGETGTCDCDEAARTCTFVDCGNSYWTMNGTMSWGESTVWDLTINTTATQGTTAGATYTIVSAGNLTVTATSIDGTMSSDGTYDYGAAVEGQATAGVTGWTWESDAAFDAVQYNASGCPTSGSVEISATYSVAGTNYTGGGTVTFDGSDC